MFWPRVRRTDSTETIMDSTYGGQNASSRHWLVWKVRVDAQQVAVNFPNYYGAPAHGEVEVPRLVPHECFVTEVVHG